VNRRIGDPRSRFEPAALARALRGLGFSEAEVADAAALRARYLAGRTDGLGLDHAHVMRARV
jgi:hypothetical protein